MRLRLSALMVLAVTALAGLGAEAQTPAPGAAPAAAPAPNVRLRGVVDSLVGDVLTIKTREGPLAVVKLAPTWTVQSVLAVKLTDIKAGDFVGASAIKAPDGRMMAEAIHYLDPAIRERAQGDIPWDLSPQSLMINADFGQVVSNANGQMVIKLSHNKATYDLVIGPNTPIVKYGVGDRAQVVKGAAVFVSGPKQPDGTYTATTVRAETNGVKPAL